jgi:LysR family hydrogen peroxide-inducible transcriptional activator
MTFQQLEYAIALKKAGSYGRAARAVGISQPAMSIQIRKLEQDIGLTLFDRSQKKVRITEEGAVFLERAQLLLTQARQLEDLAHQLGEGCFGTIHIGIIPTLAPYLLPLFMEKLNKQFPKLTIFAEEAVTEEIIHGIKSGTLDVGIIATPIESKVPFIFEPLFYESFLLFISNNHPLFKKAKIDIGEVPKEDILLLREGNCLRNQVENICDLKTQHNAAPSLFHFESTSIESLCRIVEYKGGITVLPELTTLYFDSERENMIKELKGPKRVREISLVYLPNHVKHGTISQIGQLIKDSVPKRLLKKGGFDPVHTNVKV